VRREDIRNVPHHLATDADNLAFLVSDPNQDQSAIRVGHRRRALRDLARTAAFLEIDGQRLTASHLDKVPDPVDSHVSGGAVQKTAR
jgi:hypothetical protein